MSSQLEHFGNPVMRWMMRNVVVYVDKNGNISCDKKRSREKIDGVIASITAIGEYMTITIGGNKEIEEYELRSV